MECGAMRDDWKCFAEVAISTSSSHPFASVSVCALHGWVFLVCVSECVCV
jgi:hypothetical protein